MNLPPRSTRGGLAALACAVLASLASPAFAQAPQRVLDKLEGGLQRLVPLDDGSVVVVTTVQARRAIPAHGASNWTSSQVAALVPTRGKQRMFVAAWSGGPSWWLLRSDAKDSSSTVWDNLMLGPFAAAGASAPVAKKTAPAGRTHVINHDTVPVDARAVAAASSGAGYLVYVAGLAPGDPNQLQRFGADGVAQPAFIANSAPALEQAGLERVVAGADSGWWIAGNRGPTSALIGFVARLADDGRPDARFAQDGRFQLTGDPARDASTGVTLDPQDLLDDGNGTLWILIKRIEPARVGIAHPSQASRRLLVRALATDSGATLAAREPVGTLLDDLAPPAEQREFDWTGFVRGALVPTVCAASHSSSDTQQKLRCIAFKDGRWAALGKPLTLESGHVKDIVARRADTHALLIGLDGTDGRAVLLAWEP